MADSSILIHASKNPRLLSIVKGIADKVLIPPAVRQETVERGKELGKTDAITLEGLLEEGFIEVVALGREAQDLKGRLLATRRLSVGEVEAIALAKERRIAIILMDDQLASKAAKAVGLRPRPLTNLLVAARMKRDISPAEALAILDEMVRRGYRLSSEDYLQVKTAIERVAS